MKKIYCITLSFLLILILHTAASASMKIVFATQDFFPFSYEKDGRIEGPGAEIIRIICERMNAKYEIKLFPWRRSQSMMKKGQVQALFMVGKNKEREKWLEFTPPIIATEYGFFQCDEKPIDFKGIESLAGKRVGVYGPSNTSHQLYKIARKIGWNMTVDLTPDDLTQFRKLSRCRVDAVYSSKDVGLATIKQLQVSNISYVATEQKLNYYIAFSPKTTPAHFIRQFNIVITEMKKTGELQTILDKYAMKAAE